MKKLTLLVTVLLMSFILAACGGSDAVVSEAEPATESEAAEDMSEESAEEPADTDEVMDEEQANEEESATIVDLAIADGRFNTLVTAVVAADLAETLSGEGEFTVFAPTDDAFAALPEGTVESFLEDPEGALTDVLLYHVVDGAVPAETVVTLDSATTLNGEDVSIMTTDDGQVMLNDSVMVTITDIEASNGIIHVIDGVLVPSSVAEASDESTPSIAEIAAEDGRFNTLVAAVTEAGLVETLSGEGEFTVFAPTDDAFAALPEGTVESLLADPEGALTDVLLYHVVDGAVSAETVVTLDSATMLNGEDVNVSVVDGEVFLNDDIQVVITDIEASNGIIHVIDGVLVPSSVAEASEEEMTEEDAAPSIAEIAAEDGRFNTLVAAVTEAGLAETLSSEGEFTVFAPTDEAFAALPEGTVDSLLADPEGALTDVLLYHVVDGVVPAETVITLDSATTLNGEDVSVSVVDGEVFLNEDIQVVITDIEASNGIIHVIDGVLVPSNVAEAAEGEMMAEEALPSIAEIAAEDGRFNTLVAAVTEAGLAETLSGEGEFTVFAPTDDAFAALPEGTVESLLADPEGALTDVLLYHVVDGAVPAETVVTLDSATALNGEDVTVTVVDGEVFLNEDIQVVITDIEASNGIIHVIDGVLVPQSLAQASADEDMVTVMVDQSKMQSQYKMQSPVEKQSCSPRA